MIQEAVGAALNHFGRIDILVNNAGINIPQWAVDVSEDDWVLDINLVSCADGRRSTPRHAAKALLVDTAMTGWAETRSASIAIDAPPSSAHPTNYHYTNGELLAKTDGRGTAP